MRCGTWQDPPKKVTTLHCKAACGSVYCADDITNRNYIFFVSAMFLDGTIKYMCGYFL